MGAGETLMGGMTLKTWLESIIRTPLEQAMAAVEGLVLDLTEPAYGAINRSRAARAAAATAMKRARKKAR